MARGSITPDLPKTARCATESSGRAAARTAAGDTQCDQGQRRRRNGSSPRSWPRSTLARLSSDQGDHLEFLERWLEASEMG